MNSKIGVSIALFTASIVLSQSINLLSIQKVNAADFKFTKIADKNTPIPNSVGNFQSFGSPSISGNNIAFQGYNFDNYGRIKNQGIYVSTGLNGGLTKIADKNTLIPSGIGNFRTFGSQTISGNSIVFEGYGYYHYGNVDQQGIYVTTPINSALTKFVDKNTLIPDFTSKKYVRNPSISGSNIAFMTGEADETGYTEKRGIYANTGENGALIKIAGTNTPIPDSDSNFHYFEGISISGSKIAFAGIIEDNYYEAYREIGVYLYADGVLSKVISSADTLVPGKTIRNIHMSNQGLDGESLAFLTAFNDNSMAIFRADRISEPVPEPLTLSGTEVAGVIGFWLKKKKKKVVV
ncbi:PEP-CTERM sorting domain-containing protein [Chlorogloeopsis sp. ULAP02]|uniref:DUF7453 family protein n=1 Tax=Chlorogloeopsis sp. ULAP02 TaxID=3107926 RepID=UPI0031357246